MAHKTDVWRYAKLLQHGGLYIDADVQLGPHALPADVWESSDAIVVVALHWKVIFNGFMYMRSPGNPLMRGVLERMREHLAANPNFNFRTIPNYHFNLHMLRKEVEALTQTKQLATLFTNRNIVRVSVPPSA